MALLFVEGRIGVEEWIVLVTMHVQVPVLMSQVVTRVLN